MGTKTVNWWTTKQVARFYRVTERTIRNWVQEGKLTPIWPDRKRAWKFYPQEQFEEKRK